METLNEAFESLNKIYEGYDIDTYSGLEVDEVKEAQEEFRKLNKEGILDYEVFHKAYDAALKQNAAGLIDQIFDDEGKLKGKYVYGAIKRIYPEYLGRVAKQLWALAFVDNVVANRQEYADKKKAEREQRKAEEEAEKERLRISTLAYERDSDLAVNEYNEAKAKLKRDEELQSANVVAAAEKAFSEDFKKRYLAACNKASLADCIQVKLDEGYHPAITFIGLKEGSNFSDYKYEVKKYTNEDKDVPLSSERTYEDKDGIKYRTPHYSSISITRYTYDETIGAQDVFGATDLAQIFADFETETAKVMDEVDRMSAYKTVFTVEDLLAGFPQKDAMVEFTKHHNIDYIYVELDNHTLFTANIKDGPEGRLVLNKDDVILLNSNKVINLYAMKYDFKGGSGTFGNDPHGSYWADENWRVAINDNAPASLRTSLKVDEEPLFGSTGGTEIEPKSDEAELGFDHYFEMEYVIDTSG